MASQRVSVPAKRLFDCLKPQQRCPVQLRSMATTTSNPSTPEATLSESYLNAQLDNAPTEAIIQDHTLSTIPSRQSPPLFIPHQQPQQSSLHRNPFLTTTQTTLHAFPTLEPIRLATYPSTHLLVPLRKDILHRAVIYEGDSTRQGTASTKWRSEVHGSNKKIRPQKGTGSARLGDKKSPMLRGGGVAFGPKPRDFSTELPRRVYDLAWRIAVSHRYRLGQLVVLDGKADLLGVSEHSRSRYLRDLLRYHRMGHADGRTLFVTMERREGLNSALEADGEGMGRQARVRAVGDVDVKDLLGMGRLVVERKALDWILTEHQSDLNPDLRLGAWRRLMDAQGIA